MCAQELVQVKQFWELKSILQKGMGGVEQVLRSSGGGALMSVEVCLDMLQLYWRVVLLQVTQVGGAGRGLGRNKGYLMVDVTTSSLSLSHTHTHFLCTHVQPVSTAQDEASYCKDIHSLVVWCEGVCGQAIREANSLEGQERVGPLRKRRAAATAHPPGLSEHDQTALKVAQVSCSPQMLFTSE